MSLPSAYTENELAVYLHATLNQGGFANDLQWSVAGGSYDEIVNDALTFYGASDIATITGITAIRSLRIAARVALWRAVAGATVHFVDMSTPDGSRANLSKIHESAMFQLDIAKSEAAVVGLVGISVNLPITVGRIRYKDDPYQYYVADDDSA
jgi:hypothetical protein